MDDEGITTPDRVSLRGFEELEIVQDEATDPVPCATWDPDQPDNQKAGLSSLHRPVRVTLKPGDILYLPSLW